MFIIVCSKQRTRQPCALVENSAKSIASYSVSKLAGSSEEVWSVKEGKSVSTNKLLQSVSQCTSQARPIVSDEQQWRYQTNIRNIISDTETLYVWFSHETVNKTKTLIMADFDAIYEDQQQDEIASILDSPDVCLVPDPIVIRGAGNITV